jgi:hypothetical protein
MSTAPAREDGTVVLGRRVRRDRRDRREVTTYGDLYKELWRSRPTRPGDGDLDPEVERDLPAAPTTVRTPP